MTTPLELKMGDILRLRKPHACGGDEWQVTRLGADIGLRCATCRRYRLVPRSELERSIKGQPRRE
jgi:hypothetical protein